MAALTQAPASLRLRASGARHASRRAGALVVKAAKADGSNQGTSVAVAVAAPVAALAVSSALISSGSISTAGIEAYLHATAGFVFDANAAGQVPELVTKYFHGLNMATVLLAMGGYGAYLGWEIRKGNGGEPTFGTPDTAADLHPKLMLGMTLFFAAGGQGGLLFNLLQGKPILESPHAVSALAGLMLLGANGVLSSVMGDSPNLRTTHAFLGTALMLVFAVHAALGVQLALSL